VSPSSPLSPDRPSTGDSVPDLEVEVASEIAGSLLSASSPLETYRKALARVTPLVGASFASVFLRDREDPDLLRLACAHNWPQASARFLSDIRIREGRGPTGRAVRQGDSVEVEDVFAQGGVDDWLEPAREMGFASMTAQPLVAGDRVFGALSFYFVERQQFDERARTLLRIVAHQLAATAERASLNVDLRAGEEPGRNGPEDGSR
jgi:GAF domain-containing protein